jgi:hypothetical protein
MLGQFHSFTNIIGFAAVLSGGPRGAFTYSGRQQPETIFYLEANNDMSAFQQQPFGFCSRFQYKQE